MYRKIGLSNYKLEKGDLVIMASYPKQDNEAKGFAMKFSATEIPVAVFNLRKSKDEEDDVIRDSNLYLDYRENIDIDYIEEQCHQVQNHRYFRVIIIDYNKEIKCINDNLGLRLKKLSQELGAKIFLLCDLKESATINEYPTLEDINNQELIEFADSIWLMDEEKGICILAKNAHGDVGIVEFNKTIKEETETI